MNESIKEKVFRRRLKCSSGHIEFENADEFWLVGHRSGVESAGGYATVKRFARSHTHTRLHACVCVCLTLAWLCVIYAKVELNFKNHVFDCIIIPCRSARPHVVCVRKTLLHEE